MNTARHFNHTGYSTPELAAAAASLYMAEWDNGYTDFVVFEYAGIYSPLYEVVFTRTAHWSDAA